MSTFFLPSLFPEIYLNNLCGTPGVSTWHAEYAERYWGMLADTVPEIPLQRLAHRRARLHGSRPSALRSEVVDFLM